MSLVRDEDGVLPPRPRLALGGIDELPGRGRVREDCALASVPSGTGLTGGVPRNEAKFSPGCQHNAQIPASAAFPASVENRPDGYLPGPFAQRIQGSCPSRGGLLRRRGRRAQRLLVGLLSPSQVIPGPRA